jgi:hypothetical protein
MARTRRKKVGKKTKAKQARIGRKAGKARRARPSKRAERDLDEGLRETFPGSDAVAVTDPTRSIKE